jgi:hypothetical protein
MKIPKRGRRRAPRPDVARPRPWQRYEKAILEKYFRDFPGPAFCVEPRGEAPFYFTGRHSGAPRQLDVAVFRSGDSRPFLIVDAKHWGTKLDVADVDAFLGFIDDVGAELGVLIASSGFSESSYPRAKGATQSVRLEIISPEAALRYDWLRVGRSLFPADWAFHEQLGEALRLIEFAADASAIADVLESVPFEEWQSFVGHAVHNQQREATNFLRWVAQWHFDDGWRFNAIRVLEESDLLDDELRNELLRRERDAETRRLLIENAAE